MGDVLTRDSQFPKTATELRDALNRDEVSFREVIDYQEDLLSRNRDLNAIVEASDPKRIERRIGQDSGDARRYSELPLYGVPISVKDIIAVKDLHLTGGSLLLQDNVAQVDAPVVRRLEDGGGFVIGKTNCPEFAFGVGTSNDLFGRTYNPLNPVLSPGGSSGGEASSVAVGTSLLGIGSDYGGSIRWPAQCTGVLGIRPTPGRVPSMGQIVGAGKSGLDGESIYSRPSLQSALQVPGFLARSVADLGLAVTNASGYYFSDPTSVPVSEVLGQNLEMRGLKVAWSDGVFIAPVDSEIVDALSKLASLLEEAGVRVVGVHDMFKGAREAFDDLRSYDDLGEIRQLARGREEMLSEGLRSILDRPIPSRDGYADAYERAMYRRSEALQILESYPICVLPVAGATCMNHDNKATIGSLEVSGFDLMAHCRAVSLIGAPVLSMPIAKSRKGTPISVQIVGKPWQESQVLAFASVLEELGCGWQELDSVS